MSRSPQSSRVSPLLGVLALCLTLFFVIAFVSQSLQARRLTAWRDSLAAEIESMERERDDLLLERERRQSPEYADEVLREAGYAPKDAVRVVAVPITATPASPGATESAASAPAAEPAGEPIPGTQWFDNPNWYAWRRLVLGE